MVEPSRLPDRSRRADTDRRVRPTPHRQAARDAGRPSRQDWQRTLDPTESGWRLTALLAFVAVGGLYLVQAVRTPAKGLVGALLLPLVVVAGLGMVSALARVTAVPFDLIGIAGTGLGLRLVGAYARFTNPVDAATYHREGERLAAAYRAFDFSADPLRPVPGTGALRIASGVVHMVTFDDFFLSLLVFTLGSFAGACLFVRALHVGFPEADLHRYAMLLFLLPSLVFWPSSLGKEAWMILGLGIFALGAAHLYSGATGRGTAELALGLALTTLVRPHVSVLALAALGVGFLGTGTDRTRVRTTARVIGVLLLVLGGAILARSTADRLQLERLGTEEVMTAQERTVQITTSGESAFDPVVANDPVSYGLAAVTVLFRPLPGEVPSLEGLLTSTESLFIAGLLVVSIPRFRGFWRNLRQHHYLLLSVTFTLGFIWAFSAIGNFGILTRQRSQVLPFFLVLAALPPVVHRAASWRDRLRPGRRAGGTAASGDDAGPDRSTGLPPRQVRPGARH